MTELFHNLNPQALVLLRLSAMLCFAFCFSRIAKLLRFPNVTGYIISGIVIGPYALNLVSSEMVDSMSFMTDIALAIIAFGTGQYFKWSTLKRSGWNIIVITLLEALMAALVISLTMIFVFRLSVPFSLLLGAIASATAPASTLMTIRQYKAKGVFVDTLLQVVALDDAVALVAFSVCATIAELSGSQGSVNLNDVVLPIVYNILSLGLGAVSAYILHYSMRRVHSSYNHLLLVVTLLLFLSGVCAVVHISPLLSCMVFGTVHTNISSKNTVFKRVTRFSPPVLTLFFVISGMRLDLSALTTAGVIGVVYFFVRIIGKYAGASLGALLTRSSDEVKKYLGLALIPQAGVSIGLAALGSRILPAEMGALLSTIILSSSVLYEMAGPAAAKLAMHLAGVISIEAATPARTQPYAAACVSGVPIPEAMEPDEDLFMPSILDSIWSEDEEDDQSDLGISRLFPFRKNR